MTDPLYKLLCKPQNIISVCPKALGGHHTHTSQYSIFIFYYNSIVLLKEFLERDEKLFFKVKCQQYIY